MKRLTWAALGLAAVGLVALAGSVVTDSQRSSDDSLSSTAQQSANVASSAATHRPELYIVRLREAPAAAYTGNLPGLRATRPARGKKLDPQSPDVVRYASYLDTRHDAALARVGGGVKRYGFHYAFNGFAAELSPGQAAQLARDPGVLSVEKDYADRPDTISTPAFLGLPAAGGLWSQLGGVGSAGEDVVIGVIDTGVWPEHPSFSDRTRSNANDVDGKLSYQQLAGWHGKCVPGEAFNASMCNNKLIGCQFFVAGHGAANIEATDFLSCRDADSHGTHTASTSGGNSGVPVNVGGWSLGNASGIAPRARLAIYKTCWRDGCFASDRVAAIDQAVADGVDVLNHSIGDTRTSFLGSVQVAFLFAADAGVFVAGSAGNEGPGASTTAAIGPWMTSVGASTHDRFFAGSVTLGNAAVYSGASLTSGTAMLPLVYAGSAPAAVDPTPADPTPFATRVALCFVNHLDPAVVSGKIVLCDRGINARVDKSLAVQQANGAGMILRNVSPSTLNADFHSVPSVHVDHIDGAAIKTYLDANGASATAQLAGGTLGTTAAPFIAGFSSRGPLLATGDILKPDVTAPGVDVLAGVSPYAAGGASFGFLSGTSMSSPHVAGLGALLKQRHPDWSPMAIKSALMTTGYQILGSGSAASPFAQGAGHVAPNAAADPGLVYDHGFNDWVAFLCGTGQLVDPGCASIAIDPSDLNLASIAIGDLPGTQTVRRRVTNVGTAGTYAVNVVAPAGISVTVTPLTLTLATGESGDYEVTFTRTTAALNAYVFGSLTWSDGVHAVKSPLVIRPVAIAAPASLSLSGVSGSTSYAIKFGYTGAFAAAMHGLVAPATTNANVVDDPGNAFDTANPGANAGTTVHTLEVPAGTSLARFALFDEFTDGEDDIDVYVYRGTTLVGVAAGATSAEQINLNNPLAATYTIYIHGFATDGPDANYTLFTWLAGADAGNATVTAPASAVIGGTGTVSINWSGLAPATRYVGVVTYQEGATERARTVLNVTTP